MKNIAIHRNGFLFHINKSKMLLLLEVSISLKQKIPGQIINTYENSGMYLCYMQTTADGIL